MTPAPEPTLSLRKVVQAFLQQRSGALKPIRERLVSTANLGDEAIYNNSERP